jgi:exodeoxyribonuclease V gamma subunit
VLRIHTSHRTEVLREAFVRALSAERAGKSAFAPVTVVVPNKNIEIYLRLGVAERLGISANLEMTFLRRLLAGLAEGAVPDGRVAAVAVVEGHLLALFHDEAALASPELEQVRAYLQAAAQPDALDKRRCQLATRLAQLFDEYAGSRPDMLAAWAAGGDLSSRGASRNEESWQRALWRAIFGPGGRLERQAAVDGVRWRSLEGLWDEAIRRAPGSFAGLSVHVFGLSYIGTAYHRMLGRLARASDVQIYTLNPCVEDLDAAPDDEASHPALAAWGRPGRENLRLLARLDGANVEASFPQVDGTSLLSHLQADIVGRRLPDETAPRSAADASLTVLPCPSLRRELEVVAAEIWGLLREDATLAARDVAVVVPEASKELYLAQLPAVFHESCDLPYNISDLPAAGSHRVADAIARLIALPFSSFTRKELLPLLTHPCLMGRFPEATPELWRDLAHQLGIVRGADRSDFEPAYLGRDLYSWQQGLVRLALGVVMDSAAGEARPLTLQGEPVMPGPAIDIDDEACLGFGLLASSLVADARFAAGRTGPRCRPIAQWLEFLRGMVRSYLVIEEDDDAGQAVIARFLATLDEGASTGLGDTKVSYRVAAELAAQALAQQVGSRGHYLGSGVTVASFVPMRAIPFRAVFVLGLGQGAFPRPPGRSELDLRGDDRLPGDVDQHDQDLYMFLESLLSARDRLCLSYVSRDEVTGDELPASSILLELRAMLGRGYLGDEQLARLFRDRFEDRPTLRRYDDLPERRAVLPASQAEHEAKARAAARPSPQPSPAAQARGLQAALPATIDIPLWALDLFLRDPLQGAARFRLGMQPDEEEDVASVEDEDFDGSKLLTSSLLRESMRAALLGGRGVPALAELEREHEQRALAAELSGQGPTGLFRIKGLREEKSVIAAWHAEASQLLGPTAVCRTFRLVPNLDPAETEIAKAAKASVVPLPAPQFELSWPTPPGQPARVVSVRVVGETGLWGTSDGGLGEHSLAFTCRRFSPRQLGTEDLRAFLDHVALAAATTGSRAPASSAVFYAKDGQASMRAWPLASLPRDEALAYLAGLCGELLTGTRDEHGMPTLVHPYLLPFEAVVTSWSTGSPLVETIEKVVGKVGSRGPIRDVDARYAPPTEDEAQRMVEARLGLFFRLVAPEEA